MLGSIHFFLHLYSLLFLPYPGLLPLHLGAATWPLLHIQLIQRSITHPGQHSITLDRQQCAPLQLCPSQSTTSTDVSPFVATSYGIPKPMIPCFESGKESDFALLKMALDNLLNSHLQLN